jgi:DNA-binding beta-propeller fold protein YncE
LIVTSSLKVFVPALLLFSSTCFGQRPVRSVIDPGVITTRQAITPAGALSIFRGRVKAVSFCGSDDVLSTLVAERGKLGIYRMGPRANKVQPTFRGENQYSGTQSLGCNAGSTVVGTQGGVLLLDNDSMRSANVGLIGTAAPTGGSADTYAYQTAARLSGAFGKGSLGSMALSGNGKVAALVLTGTNQIAVIDLETRSLVRKIAVGIAPLGIVLSSDGAVAWVSNMGVTARHGERSATTGTGQREDAVAIDAQGIAMAGNVMRVDLHTGEITDTIRAGLHPTAMAWDEAHGRLYVANGNSDSILVLDTKSRRPVVTWELQPFARHLHGIAPTSLAMAPDARRLYVACGGINAVAILKTDSGRIEGLIPTAWYPSSVTVNASGTKLAVGTLFGVGSGDLVPDLLNEFRHGLPDLALGITRRYVHSYRGTVQVIDVPDGPQLERYTAAVADNTHLLLREAAPAMPEHVAVFANIQHVVYIVKENRSYDQIFGDLEKGNGDPSLEVYGEDVTPNHRALARQFVLLDNFYATGGNSGDGHQWVTQAAESDYAMWSAYDGRSYPFDGNDPLAYASGGFLWDSALRAKRTFADFGEFIPSGQFQSGNWGPYRVKLLEQWRNGEQFESTFHVKSPIPPLDAHLMRDFPSFGGESPDVVRARIFLRHLKEWEDGNDMPNLTFMLLPSDHTAATTPNDCTPKACVADNDLALGQIVEGLSHSKFWPHMAIFVVEDDAQGGVDHVDGHRTVALAISPYIRRGSIDSTMYSHPSITKTIEMMLGLKNLSLFDLIANDMRNSFTDKPDFTAYTAVTPRQSLFDVNPPAHSLSGQARKDAIASAKMNWAIPDAAPAKQVLDILWRNAKGYDQPVPKQRSAAFLPYAPPGGEGDDDDERPRRDLQLGGN